VSLPSADELFRPTAPGEAAGTAPEPPSPAPVPEPEEPAKKPSGRVRHDEKMTVYITSDELMDLEHARLMLRRSHGLAVDRGRVVREAIAIALADFEQNGDDSVIVQRLRDPG
jgi:hypothetical protein